MKLVINLALVMGVILAVLVTLPVKDGKPFFSIAELKAILGGDTSGIDVPKVDIGDFGGGSSDQGNAYRWQDKDGKWHFSDRAQVDNAETIELKQVQTVSSNVAASDEGIDLIGDAVVVDQAKEE